MKYIGIGLLCWLAASIIVTIGYIFGRKLANTNTPDLPPVIPLHGPEDRPFIEVTWGDGTKTRHKVIKKSEVMNNEGL